MPRNGRGDRVQLGGLLNTLITAAVLAGAGAVIGIPVLAWRASANEQKVEKIDQRQRAIEMNQAVLTRDSAWTTKMLEKLLEAKGIPVPTPPPLKQPTP